MCCGVDRDACGARRLCVRWSAKLACLPRTSSIPLFICPGEGQRREVGSMPGVFQLSVDEAVKEAAGARPDGVPGVLLFGLPDQKDVVGSTAYDPEGSGAAGNPRDQAGSPRSAGHHRCLPLRIHLARALRHHRGRRNRQRRRPSSSSRGPRCRMRSRAPTSSHRQT